MPPVKKLRLTWLPAALRDLRRLHAFLKEKNPDAAIRASETIRDGAALLLDTAEIGFPLPDGSGRRELYVRFGAGTYVLRYRIIAGSSGEVEAIVILRVWHSRENRDRH